MSRADNKRKIFTTIGTYTSLNQSGKMPKQSDIFTSINNKSDAIPYLLDVLKCVAGTDALKETIGGLFTKVIDTVEPELKLILKKQFIQSNANEKLSTSFKTDGITVPVKNIDTYGKLQLSPLSSEGSLLYDTTVPNFDTVAHDAILNSNTEKIYSNLSIKYVDTLDSFQIKPNIGSSNPNISDFFENYIDNAEIINKKEIITTVMDGVYGTMAKKQKKTIEQIYNELQTDLILNQVLNAEAINLNSAFMISPADYDELQQKSREMADGVVYYNMGCGVMSSELSFDDLNSLVTNNYQSTDPFAVGNAIESTIDQSTSGSTSTADTTKENKQTIKDGFFQRIIKIFTNKLLGAITIVPQIRVLFGIMSSLQNNGIVNLSLPKDDLINIKISIKCMAKEIMKIISEFIFELVVTYLMVLLKPIIKKIIKEKTNQYINIIKSLTPAGRIATELTG